MRDIMEKKNKFKKIQAKKKQKEKAKWWLIYGKTNTIL